MKKKIGAYVTVFLSLITGIIVIFILTIINGVRIQTMRMETECVMDAGLSSIFAEYHREMVKQYGLLFIDDSYGNIGNTDNTKSHLLSYMNLNFSENSLATKITGLHADNCNLSKVSFASDNSGEVLRYQITQYMKNGIGVFHKDTINLIDEGFEEEYEGYDSQRIDIDGEISEIVTAYNDSLSEDEDPVGISNPADAVEHLNSNSALYYACRDLSQLSTNVTNIDSLISKREYQEGYGLYENQSSPYNPVDQMLFMQYLFDKLAYRGKEKENAGLNYQLEYLLAGHDGDIGNLESVAEKIFKNRYLINVACVYQSALMQQQATEVAIAATSIIGQPELEEAVKQAILLAWAYAESAKDMRILFDGNKLSNIKKEEDWNTPIDQILDFKSHLDEYHIPSGEMEYKDYLYCFLLLQDKETLNKRLMDIMEIDIRLTSGNGNFRMNNMIYQLYADVNVSSKYGRGYSINRGFSYR